MPMKIDSRAGRRGQLGWWEDDILALTMWLSVVLCAFQSPAKRFGVGRAGSGKPDRDACAGIPADRDRLDDERGA